MDKISPIHNETSQSVLKALLYYDIFNYPLTSREVYINLPTNHVTEKEIDCTLNELCSRGCVFKLGNFYSVQNNNDLIERREKGNQQAQKFFYLAQRQADRIYSFPFVRSVMASGSLSKNYMDEESDLDFFIITSPGRLWIARMLLIMYKRIFLFNSHKRFCVNYFVDEDHLEIEEKNIFTATELTTLMPLAGKKYYPLLFSKNTWTQTFLPNRCASSTENENADASRILKKGTESLINFLGGDKLDNLFMNLTLKRWQRLYNKKYEESDFKIAFKTKKYVSKNHPNFYQKTVIDTYKSKLESFGKKLNIQWLYE
jgi:hypothetical protein